jgi:hypothetical protein
MPTLTIPESVAVDLVKTLARLRIARTVGDKTEINASTRRLNWLLDKLPRQEQR